MKLLALAPLIAIGLFGDANAFLSQEEMEDLAIWTQVGDFDRPLPKCFWSHSCVPDDYYSPYERFYQDPPKQYRRPYYGPRPPYLREHRGRPLYPPAPPYNGEPL